MTHRIAVVLAIPLFVLSSFSGIPFATPPLRAAAPYRITDLRVHLFYSDRGAFSDNLLARPNLALWNTIIGGGDSGGPSSSTLVVVEITGEPGSYVAGRRVEVAVRARRGEIFRRQVALDVLGPQGHGYAAFWLYNTGCEPLTISAALLGQAEPWRNVGEVPFHCGE